MYTTAGLVKRTEYLYSTDDRRFVVTNLVLITTRRKGWRIADMKRRDTEVVGFAKTLAAVVDLLNKYVEAERHGIEWPRPRRHGGLP